MLLAGLVVDGLGVVEGAQGGVPVGFEGVGDEPVSGVDGEVAAASHVFEAVAKTIAATDITTLTFEAEMIRHAYWGIPGQGYAVFVVKPGPGVLDYQARMLSGVTPSSNRAGQAPRSSLTLTASTTPR